MRFLITGGAGYIGSHTLLQLLEDGHDALVVDNFEHGTHLQLDRVRKLARKNFTVVNLDIRDRMKLFSVCKLFRPECVIHFAGLKSVSESFSQPSSYYDVNVAGTVSVLRAIEEVKCNFVVFSSSATVYGPHAQLPNSETEHCIPDSVYGRSKLMAEKILEDWAIANVNRSAVALRYFNPTGAHETGQLGEDAQLPSGNLMPVLLAVATGKVEKLKIFGGDYDTPDGTGLRDYVHVVDLARAHLKASEYASTKSGFEVFNIGTGTAVSVLEMVNEFKSASGRDIPYEIVARRVGDVAISIADPSKANRLLNWRARLVIADMCRSSWQWAQNNAIMALERRA